VDGVVADLQRVDARPLALAGLEVVDPGLSLAFRLPQLVDDAPEIRRSLRYGTDAVDVEDGAVLQYELSDGALGTLQCGYYLLEGRYDTTVSITGTGGRAIWDPMGETFDFSSTNALHLEAPGHGADGSPRRTLTHEYDDVPGYAGEFGREFAESFLEAREDDDTDPPATLAEIKTSLHVLDAAYRSANERGWQPVPADEQNF